MEQQPSGSKGFDMAAMALGTKIIFVAGILLLVDSFLQWQRFCVPSVNIPGSGTFGGGCAGVSAWSGSGSFFGLLMGLLVIILLIFEGTQLANVNLNLPIAPTKTSAYLAFAVGICAILKTLLMLTSSLKPSIFGWIGFILALVVAYGGYLQFKAPEAATPAPPAAS
jgi:hypothetical protein